MMKIIYYVLFLLVISGCAEESDCMRSSTNEIKFDFRNKNNNARRAVTINSIQVEGTDSLFYGGQKINKIIVPINFYDSSSLIIIDTEFGIDSILFEYETSSRLVSPDCGTETLIENLRIKEETLDSLVLVINILSSEEEVNYEVYY